MSIAAWEEEKPEAEATVRRWTDERLLLRGEGGTVTEGRDGETYCLHIDSGTAVDLLVDDEVDEQDWRRAPRLLRFASVEDRDAYVSARWGDLERPPDRSEAPPSSSPTAVHLQLYAGQLNTRSDFSLRWDRGPAQLSYRAEGNEIPNVELNTTAWPDEVARFLAELRLLGAPSWRQYGARAVDGLIWSLTASGDISIDAGGANAYPPDGGGEASTFDRLTLAVERLLGRELWPGTTKGVGDIPDPREHAEHLILSACRAWATSLDQEGVDPGSLREAGRKGFQGTLLPHLQALAPCHPEKAAGLLDWDPGAVDLVLELGGTRDWVELKWCRHPETFGNCLWDVAKVAAGVREARARHGYLLVGAPVSVWEGELPPTARVTQVSAHAGSSLVDGDRHHRSWWRKWCKETMTTYPRRLPTPVMTSPVGRVRHFGPPDAPWELRLIRAEAPGDATYEAPCP